MKEYLKNPWVPVWFLAALVLLWAIVDIPVNIRETWESRSRKVILPIQKLTLKELADIGDNSRRTVAQIAADLFVLVGLYFGWRRIEVAQEQVLVAKEEQVTKRSSRSVEQLGDENLAIRLGGIYGRGSIDGVRSGGFVQGREIDRRPGGGGLQKAKNLTQKQMDSATIDGTTILPYYLILLYNFGKKRNFKRDISLR